MALVQEHPNERVKQNSELTNGFLNIQKVHT